MRKLLRSLWFRLSQQPCFTLQIQAGQVRLKHGQVSRDFINGCQDIARLYGLREGLILGLQRDQHIQLRFQDIPIGYQQKFRNLWENT